MKNEIDILSEYYQYELSYLRSAGSEFSSKFPKIARRLDLSNVESSDPHVERLIESFAFLSGKLQKQIDDQFPEIASVILHVLCKPLIQPVPSCVMADFDIDVIRAIKSPGVVIPKGTLLYADSHTGERCTFMTAHDLQLYPIEITSAEVIQKEGIPHYYARSTFYLKISLKYSGDPASPSPNKLRFYIKADALLRGKIFSSIFMSEENVLLQKGERFEFIPKISSVGLEDDDSLLPYPSDVFKGFRLLQEYFVFPEKFLGFEINFSTPLDSQSENVVYIPMNQAVSMPVSVRNFSLSAVPAVNLFPKISEPLRLDQKQVEYCIVPDYRRYHSNEIYAIQKIVAADPNTNDEKIVPEFFSCSHYADSMNGNFFWKSKRKRSYISNAQGEDVYVSFIDTDFNPKLPADKIFYAHTLCTNRHVAEQIPANGELKIELSVPIKNIHCINRPTNQISSIKEGEILWKLISALSLNSISFDKDGILKLKEVLEIFANISKTSLGGEVDAILDVSCHTKTKRIDKQTWRGFIRGSCVEITFDESIFNLGIPLSMVVSKFLSSYTTINTFTEVCVKNTEKNGILKIWDQNFGIRNYL